MFFTFLYLVFLCVTFTLTPLLLFANEYVAAWHPFTLIMMNIPLYAGTILYYLGIDSKSRKDRELMLLGIMLALIGLFLYSAWDVVYFAIIN